VTASYQVILSPEAWEHLERLYEYIADEASPSIAKRFTDDILDYCNGFDLFPKRGIERDDIRQGLRFVGFRRRVTIAFGIGQNVVEIVASSMADRITKPFCQATYAHDPRAGNISIP